jgi:hypothetical protein
MVTVTFTVGLVVDSGPYSQIVFPSNLIVGSSGSACEIVVEDCPLHATISPSGSILGLKMLSGMVTTNADALDVEQ